MRFGRYEILLTAGLIFALSVVFSAPAMRLLQGVRAFEGDYGVGLLPGLALAAASFVLSYHGKRRQLQVAATTASQEAARAHERARELERLITLCQALTQSFDLDTLRDVVELYLGELAGTNDVWVAVGRQDSWQLLAGQRFIQREGRSVAVGGIAAGAIAQAGLIARPEGIDHEGQVCFPLVGAGTTLGVLGLPADVPGLTPPRRLVIGAAASVLATSLRGVQLQEEVRENSLRDALTGCVNRGHGREVVSSELRRARRSRLPLSAILFDVDGLKQVNDRYGHLCGDAVLAEIGTRIRGMIRGSDLKCRYGGDEFLVLLLETPIDAGRQVAEKLRREVDAMSVTWNGDPVQVTGSFGVAEAHRDELDASAFIARAEEALYAAKRDGRDCVRIAEEHELSARVQKVQEVQSARAPMAPCKVQER